MPRVTCEWRKYVENGNTYRYKEDFPRHKCILMSPRMSRFEWHDPQSGYPYWNVHTILKRHIYETFYRNKVLPGLVIRRHCMDFHQDSRGLCINPWHMSLGTRHDHAQDLRTDDQFRHQRDYWIPPKHKELPVIDWPMVIISTVSDMRKYKVADTLVLWNETAGNIPLSSEERLAYETCDSEYYALNSEHKQFNADQPLLSQVHRVLDSLQCGIDPTPLVTRSLRAPPRPERGYARRCRGHGGIAHMTTTTHCNPAETPLVPGVSRASSGPVRVTYASNNISAPRKLITKKR